MFAASGEAQLAIRQAHDGWRKRKRIRHGAGTIGQVLHLLPFQHGRCVGLFEGGFDHSLDRDAVGARCACSEDRIDCGVA